MAIVIKNNNFILIYLSDENGCWYHDSGQQYILIWEWVTFFGWMYASITYCAIVIIMVIRKLNLAAKQIDTSNFSSNSRSSIHPPLINKAMILSVVRRVIWYPVLPIAQIFGVFSQDIAVTRTFQAIKLQWWISIVNSYESHYPHKSHNKAIELWLRYILLIKLFSPPKITPRVISSNHLSPINSPVGNEFSAPSVLVDNQYVVQGIQPVNLKVFFINVPHHLIVLNPSEPLIGSSIEPTKRISRISEEFEGIETTLKRL
ncbi:3828_t:CDS:2 [Cetraspora pellucida]|uniref:3828_t:CDS:1 n=1 Tax=Cetraspora pellucida TaxID=1433469 RepID=A0A9N9HM56_9GLOM|nr:3828_t:CDS:2 [Cetraspora pellucida]